MTRSQIAPFRLDANVNGIDSSLLLGLCKAEGFCNFLDLLEEGVIVFDADGRIVALNKAAEKGTGIHRSFARGISADMASLKSKIDLKPLVVGQSVGHRAISLRCRDEQSEVRASLYALAEGSGSLGARVALFPVAAAGGNRKMQRGERFRRARSCRCIRRAWSP